MTQISSSSNSFHVARVAPDSEAARMTREKLGAEVARTHGPRAETPISLAARDGGGAWIGGINGVIHWRWLYVAQFLVAPDWRGKGLGRALVDEVEIFARENNCAGIYLDTFDAGAQQFYEKCGFAVAGRIENFPPGAARRFLCKTL